MEVSEHTGKDFYSVVEDKHGAKAYVYFRQDSNHKIVYKDNTNTEFFREHYDRCSIELVERAAIDWATGRRTLI